MRNLVAELKLDKEVEFLGFLNKEGVIRAFNMMDVAVFPSTLDSESFGVATGREIGRASCRERV